MNTTDTIQLNYIPIVGEFTEPTDLISLESGLSTNASPVTNSTPERNEQVNEVIATRGRIGGWTITDQELNNGTLRIRSEGYLASGKTLFDNTETGWILGVASDGVSKFYIGDTNNYMNWTGTALNIVGATVSGLAAGSEAAIQEWTYSGAFSSSDADTVAWASGTLTFVDGTAYSITGSNTGNMAAFTYIYLDVAVSTTAFQVNTTFVAGSGKVLIAVAQNGTTQASFLMMGGSGKHNLDGTNIATGSIIAGKLAVTQLSAITADLGTITAGTVTIDTSGYVRGGQTDYNTGTGFFLGYSGGAYKFSVGDPSGDYLTWDGSNLTISALLTVDLNLIAGGEAIAIRDTVSFSPNKIDLDNIVTTVGTVNIGDDISRLQRADSFVASYNSTHIQVTVRIRQVNSPTSTIIAFQTDNSGSPSGTTVGSVSITGLTGSYQDLTFFCTLGTALVAGNTYWMIINCDQAASNYLQVARDGSGSHQLNNNSVWGADNSGNLIYKIRNIGGTGIANTVFPATALIPDSANKFVGFAVAAAAASAAVKVRSDGKMAGFSALTATSTYYLSNTHGSIATSAGTTSKIVGRALSTTEVQIKYAL